MKEAKLDENRTVLLVHVEGKGIFAMGAKCTHFGAPLVKGVLAGSRVVCPWHAACFNACSGDIEDGPALDAAPSFKVQVTPEGDIFVEVPDRVPRGVPPAVASGPKDPRHMLIIGAGPAGATAAETLRSNGFTGRITMLGLENAPPYDRTKLSKNMVRRGGEAVQEHGVEGGAAGGTRAARSALPTPPPRVARPRSSTASSSGSPTSTPRTTSRCAWERRSRRCAPSATRPSSRAAT